MISSIRTIFHPTDFSDLSGAAFAHALRIALAARGKLQLLHVAKPDASAALAFPNVQRLLVQWGLSEEDDSQSDALAKLGLEVDNISLKGQDPAQSIVHFLWEYPNDLVVIATHGRDGADHWLSGSVSEDVFGRVAIPTLFVTQGARGFVSQVSGDVRLRRVLVPIDYSRAPSQAIEVIQQFGAFLTGKDILIYLIHVGNSAPPVNVAVHASPSIILRSGDVVKSIVEAAIEYDADLIGMPTAGRHGVLDALRGSTTQRVVRHAPCPVFAVPTPLTPD